MIPTGLFSQIALLILSVGIIFTYISPAFSTISVAQEQIAVYQEERGKVAAVNNDLQQKIQTIDGVFVSDRDNLLIYMPNNVDPLSVMRDLQIISDTVGVIVTDIIDAGAVELETAVDPFSVYASDPALAESIGVIPTGNQGPFAYAFSMTVDGSYSQIKNLISLVEQNNYPLEIQTLDIRAADGGFLTAEIGLYTYSQNQNKKRDVTIFEDVNVTYE